MTWLRRVLAAVLLLVGGLMTVVFSSLPTISNMGELGFVQVLVSRSRDAPIEMAVLALVVVLIVAHFATAVSLVKLKGSRPLWLAGTWLSLDVVLVAAGSIASHGAGAH